MSDVMLTIRLSDEKLSRLRRKYPQMKDEEAVLRVVDECLGGREQEGEDPEAIVARLRVDFPDNPLVELIGAIDVPVDESPAEHHDKYGLGSGL